MSGKGPKTFAKLGDLPGNAGRTNVIGFPSRTAEITCGRCGMRHAWQGDVTQDVRGPEVRRNCIISTKRLVATAVAMSKDSDISYTLFGLKFVAVSVCTPIHTPCFFESEVPTYVCIVSYVLRFEKLISVIIAIA